jgi:23S rRNA pseudouridine1911/1915/1917 synthase
VTTSPHNNDTAKAVVGVEDEDKRLDLFLAASPGIVSRSVAQRLIEAKEVSIEGRSRPKNYRLKLGQEVRYRLPAAEAPTVEGEDLPLAVVYEDDQLIVIDKPDGQVVHPAVGNFSGTVVNALLNHTRLAEIGAPLRPGIVHRLDKDTSGLMVAAKTDEAYMALVRALKARRVSRRYLALVEGGFTEERGVIEAPIGRSPRDRKLMTVGVKGAKEAVTRFTVKATTGTVSLLELALETGRTHQIRVHLKHIKHPVIGDPVYGSAGLSRKLGFFRQWLHAFELAFPHPTTGDPLSFTSPPPADLIEVLLKVDIDPSRI